MHDAPDRRVGVEAIEVDEGEHGLGAHHDGEVASRCSSAASSRRGSGPIRGDSAHGQAGYSPARPHHYGVSSDPGTPEEGAGPAPRSRRKPPTPKCPIVLGSALLRTQSCGHPLSRSGANISRMNERPAPRGYAGSCAESGSEPPMLINSPRPRAHEEDLLMSTLAVRDHGQLRGAEPTTASRVTRLAHRAPRERAQPRTYTRYRDALEHASAPSEPRPSTTKRRTE